MLCTDMYPGFVKVAWLAPRWSGCSVQPGARPTLAGSTVSSGSGVGVCPYTGMTAPSHTMATSHRAIPSMMHAAAEQMKATDRTAGTAYHLYITPAGLSPPVQLSVQPPT